MFKSLHKYLKPLKLNRSHIQIHHHQYRNLYGFGTRSQSTLQSTLQSSPSLNVNNTSYKNKVIKTSIKSHLNENLIPKYLEDTYWFVFYLHLRF